MTPPLAHAGGWDELALVAVPVLVYGTLHLIRGGDGAPLWRRGGPLAVGVVLLVVAGGLWWRAGGPGGSPTAATPPGGMLAGLCEATAAARAGDAAAADAAFSGEPHRQLHELARDLRAADNAVSADLLEAKNRVETTLAGGDADLAAQLDELVAVTRRGLGRLDRPAPPCEQLDR